MTEAKLLDYRQTIREIFRMAKAYKKDVLQFAGHSLRSFYELVKALPFVADPSGIETVSRPRYTLVPGYEPRDCDDKTLILAAFCELQSIPYRLVVSGKVVDQPQHVYLELLDGTALDATYPDRGGWNTRLFPEQFRKIFIYAQK